MTVTLAIVGRPNVGKSTLFNRLVGKRLALVDDRPGVTRDRRQGEAKLGDLTFSLFDTAGLEDADDDALEGRMRDQTLAAIEEADICLFMIDARAGVTPVDKHFAEIVRKSSKPTLLIANKCEGSAGNSGLYDAFSLGLGDPVAMSAEHGEGLGDLYGAIEELIRGIEQPDETRDLASDGPEDETTDRATRIAVVGRPNAGKSTLINSILGQDRMLTGPEAGITRDSISVDLEWDGHPVRLFDTAGMRRKSRVVEKLEKLSVDDALRAIRFAEVVVLVIDVTQPFEKQDLQIADLIVREGRALVIAANKWDMIENPGEVRAALREQCERLLPQVRGVPIVSLSALTGKGIDRLSRAISEVYATWNRRISTSALNDWLAKAVDRHNPPAVKGRRLRLRYMTQAKTRPPTFVVFCSRADELPDSYVRYLVNGLREDFDLPAVPIRLFVRKRKNPYAD